MIDVAIATITTHSERLSGTVCRNRWKNGAYTASIWRDMTITVAPSKYLLEKKSIRKNDLLSERQFHTLNHWKTASTVSEIVQAFPVSVSKYFWNRKSVPSIIGSAIRIIRRTIRPSTRYFFGRSKVPESNPLSFGSIASATSRNPSVTKLSQIICVARSGSG